MEQKIITGKCRDKSKLVLLCIITHIVHNNLSSRSLYICDIIMYHILCKQRARKFENVFVTLQSNPTVSNRQ